MTTAPSPLVAVSTAMPPSSVTTPAAAAGQGHAFAGLLSQVSQAMARHPASNGAADATQPAGAANGAPATTDGAVQQTNQASGSDAPALSANLANPATNALPGAPAPWGPDAETADLGGDPKGLGTGLSKDTPKAGALLKSSRKETSPAAGQDSTVAAASTLSVPPQTAAMVPAGAPTPARDAQHALHDTTASAAPRPLAGAPGPSDATAATPVAPASSSMAPSFAFGGDTTAAGIAELSTKSATDPQPAELAPPPAALAASAASSTASPVKAGGAPAAVQQVAPVLVQLSHQAGGGQMTLQLDPLELGKVQIQIDRSADGAAAVHVSAERPETLQLLVADQAQLHKALDAAGVPTEGRTLSLGLSTPDQGAGGQASGGMGQGGANNQTGGQTGGQQGGQQNRNLYGWGAGLETATDGGGAASWLRAGVDITA